MKKDTARLSGGLRLTLLRFLVVLAAGVGWAALIAQVLGPRGAGLLTLALLLPQLTAPLCNTGLPWSLAYLAARGRYRPGEIRVASLATLAVLAPAGVACGLLVTWAAEPWLGAEARPLLVLSWAGLPAVLGLQILLGTAHGLRQFRVHALCSMTPVLLSLAAGAISVRGGRSSASDLLWAWLAGHYIPFAWLLLDTVARATWSGTGRLRRLLGEAIRYGWKLYLAELATLLRVRVDQIVVSGLLGPAALGLYSSAGRIVDRLGLVSQAGGFVLFPTIAATGDRESARRELTPSLARWNLYVGAGAALALALCARSLVSVLFGPEFAGAVEPLRALLPGAVALCLSRVLTADLLGRGRSGLILAISLIALAAGVAANVILVRALGVVGAAYATSGASLLNAAMRVWAYRRVSGVPVLQLFVFVSSRRR